MKLNLSKSLIYIFLTFAFSVYSNDTHWNEKAKGLVWGSLYGDAFGGPFEFLKVQEHPLIKKNIKLNNSQWSQLAKSVRLVDYKMKASPYGAWEDFASAGTITDDSRHKIIFWSSLKNKKRNKFSLSNSYVSYFKKNKNYQEWLGEYVKSAYFNLDKNHPHALPPARLWGGIPTQAGQMIYLMNSLFYIDNPKEAYKSTYYLNIFDNGEALDFTSAVVAGLSHALSFNANWDTTKDVMRNTDPYHYSKVPFVKRKVTECIDLAHKLVELADGNPKKLFSMLKQNIKAKTWWEADTAFIISYAFLEMTKDYPLAALALTREFGHDTDSYAQLIGAFLGALYGESLFNTKEISLIKFHIQTNYDSIFKEFE